MAIDPDQYGDDGAVADAQWSARWTKWSPAAIDRSFSEAAEMGPLGAPQCISLIQGFPPPPMGWRSHPSVLAEKQSAVARFQEDVAAGLLSKVPTPHELMNWCSTNQIPLPDSFVAAVAAKANSQTRSAPASHSPAAVIGSLPVSTRAQKPKGLGGRPKTSENDVAALIAEADRLLMVAARAGNDLTLDQVARALAASAGYGIGSSIGTIVRRLKGKTCIPVAKSTALLARARAAAKHRAAPDRSS